jgi:uncharacterized protein with FMN-binding domain
MKKVYFIIIALLFIGCASKEMRMVRQMDIQKVDTKNIQDGEYIGSFSYSSFKYMVKTFIKGHRIIEIEILQNKDTKRAKRAEGVIPEIIKKQSPNVDAISGATTTSKALMKAVEKSLESSVSM